MHLKESIISRLSKIALNIRTKSNEIFSNFSVSKRGLLNYNCYVEAMELNILLPWIFLCIRIPVLMMC